MNSDYVFMSQMLSSYIISQSLCAVAELGISDVLVDGPKTLTELASATKTLPDGLYRVLRCLTSVGIYEEQPDKTFALNDKARCLCAEAPGSLKPWAQLVGKPFFRDVWTQLPAAMGSDTCMFEQVHEQSVYAFLQQHPQHLKLFQAAMATGTTLHTSDFVSAYDFNTLHSILDVGGGDGSLLRALHSAYPHLQLHLFELPMVIAHIPESARAHIQPHSGNFFTDTLPHAEAIILKWIVHNWTDDQVVSLFQNCHKALPSTGKLLIYERIIPGPNIPSESKLLDLNMMLMQGGRERSKEEFTTLLDKAGFILNHIYTTSTSMCIIEGFKRAYKTTSFKKETGFNSCFP